MTAYAPQPRRRWALAAVLAERTRTDPDLPAPWLGATHRDTLEVNAASMRELCERTPGGLGDAAVQRALTKDTAQGFVGPVRGGFLEAIQDTLGELS